MDMNTLTKWIMLAVVPLLTAFTGGNELTDIPNEDGNTADISRRETPEIKKNKLCIAAMAATAENSISTFTFTPVVSYLSLKLATGETATLNNGSSIWGKSSSASADWGTDGVAWFDFTFCSIAAGAGKSIHIKIKDNLMNLDTSKVKEATVILATEGDTARFKVTPVWVAPANATTPSVQPTAFTVNAGAHTEIRVVAPFGGGAASSLSDNIVRCESFNSPTGILTLKGVSAGSTTIKVYNKQDPSKSIDYAVTVKEIPASSYVSITSSDGKTLKWAVGNLVAQGPSSCTIGTPTDKGVHFRWGSLVGYDANDVTTNPSTPAVKPNGYRDSPTFLASEEVTAANLPASPSATWGQGDPCQYYLGGSWRLPTADEYRNNLGCGVTSAATFKVRERFTTAPAGIKMGHGKELFFPAAGLRDSYNGNLKGSGGVGSVWSSSPDGRWDVYHMFFYAGGADMNHSSRTTGRSVRCVQE